MPTDCKNRKEILYFCDESSFIGDDHMAVGGLALPKAKLKLVTAKLKSLHKTPQREEIKWTTTKQWNVEIRKAYIDCLARLVSRMQAHLHIRFAPFSIYEHDGQRRIF